MDAKVSEGLSLGNCPKCGKAMGKVTVKLGRPVEDEPRPVPEAELEPCGCHLFGIEALALGKALREWIHSKPTVTHAGYPGSGLARCGAPIGALTVAPGQPYTCVACAGLDLADDAGTVTT